MQVIETMMIGKCPSDINFSNKLMKLYSLWTGIHICLSSCNYISWLEIPQESAYDTNKIREKLLIRNNKSCADILESDFNTLCFRKYGIIQE